MPPSRADGAVPPPKRVAADGARESCTSTDPPLDFDRISKPESRNTSSIAVLSASVVA